LPVSRFEAAASTVNEENAFSPLGALVKAIRFWWVVFLMMAAGGLVGWLVSQSQPPVYEAVGQFSASIDLIGTGPLTQYEEDVALNAISDLIKSPVVTQQVIDQAAAQGIQISMQELKKNSVVERKFSIFELRVRSGNAQTAERIANLWVERGQAQLLESYRHAIAAEHLLRYLRSLENCLAQAGASEQVNVACSQPRLGEIQEEILQAGEALYQERLASNGLFSGLTIGPANGASVSGQAVLYDRNQMVLMGGLIGLVLGAVLVQLNIPARWLKRD
jgi:uncharacterized protein involved in exopolysaccharide biosynthesis